MCSYVSEHLPVCVCIFVVLVSLELQAVEDTEPFGFLSFGNKFSVSLSDSLVVMSLAVFSYF